MTESLGHLVAMQDEHYYPRIRVIRQSRSQPPWVKEPDDVNENVAWFVLS